MTAKRHSRLLNFGPVKQSLSPLLKARTYFSGLPPGLFDKS